MTGRQASMLHVILLHVSHDPELRTKVGEAAGIDNFPFVLPELIEAVAGHMGHSEGVVG